MWEGGCGAHIDAEKIVLNQFKRLVPLETPDLTYHRASIKFTHLGQYLSPFSPIDCSLIKQRLLLLASRETLITYSISVVPNILSMTIVYEIKQAPLFKACV